MAQDQNLKSTPLNALHRELGAKMVPFAGYDMPVQFPLGVLKEHLHTRAAAGLFDVSHMGQAWLISEDGADPAIALESLIAADIQGLGQGCQRYSQLLNDAGGILDDLMVTRPSASFPQDRLYLVVNAACKDADYAYLVERLAGRLRVERLEDRALLALQGPAAAEVAARLIDPALATLSFMAQHRCDWQGADLWISRSGYTGEDGYEISVPADRAEDLARALLAEDAVESIGLGARDSLRLEAGLCLYGHDMNETNTPVEAGLSWSIGKRRREAADFPGADLILKQLRREVPYAKRVGIRPQGSAPVRAGVEILDPADESVLGTVTSGGFGPSIEGPVCMGYCDSAKKPGEPVLLRRRGTLIEGEIITLPFVPSRFYRG